MFGLSLNSRKKDQVNVPHKYYKCSRCSYISVVKNATCPICIKDGFTIKMK